MGFEDEAEQSNRRPHRQSDEEWKQVYRDSWKRYYTDAHVQTILRRAVASGLSPRKIVDALAIFSGSARIEGVHPFQFGFVRRKVRTQRRYGMPIVNPLLFYPWRAIYFVAVALRWIVLVWRYRAIMKRTVADAAGQRYVDEALAASTSNTTDDFVQVFASKIPKTYGAPAHEPAN